MEVNTRYLGSSDNLQTLYTRVHTIDDQFEGNIDISGSYNELKELKSKISEEEEKANSQQKTYQDSYLPWKYYSTSPSQDLKMLSDLNLKVEKLQLSLNKDFTILPNDIIKFIFSFLAISPGKIYNLSLISQKSLIMANDDFLWSSICLKETPEIQKKFDDTGWKTYCQFEMYLTYHEGDFISVVNYIADGIKHKYAINCNPEKPSSTILHLKKLLKRQNYLNFPIEDMNLYSQGKQLTDNLLLKELKNPLLILEELTLQIEKKNKV